jgi:peptidoglycan/xylan/chitin deacetylase (PgdA/CDA1 family)
MYHSISDGKENGINPYYRTITSPKVFAMQMRFLSENGYVVIGLPEALRLLSDSSGPCQSTDHQSNQSKTLHFTQGTKSLTQPINYVVLTFDDGYRDFLTDAFPILQRYGFTATVFLSTGYVGNSSFKERECLSWAEVKDLKKQGIDFGSHTISHPQLSNLNRRDIEREIVESKRAIETKIGRAVDSFSYPYRFPEESGAFRRVLKEIMGDAGYTYGVTTVIGRASGGQDPFFMPRLPVNASDDAMLFRAKLDGHYDWVHIPQLLTKVLKKTRGWYD